MENLKRSVKGGGLRINPLIVILIFIILVQAFIILRLFYSQKGLVEKEERGITKARIAIVLDDWGYSLRNITHLEKIDIPLTLSILPAHRYSQKIARYAQDRGLEIILHLPLEPMEHVRLESDTILTSMSKEQVVEILNRQLKSFSGISGVSNHMGSKATASRELMKIILSELARGDLFFLDNLVTTASVGKKVAKELSLSLVRRDIFLDNKQDYEYIAGQLDKLIELAKVKGKAIGVGHDRKLTLMVLKDKLSKFDFSQEAIEFVFVSQLLE